MREILPRRFADDRGFFAEVYNEHDLALAGIAVRFVQDNLALSLRPGTVRGLHFQRPPAAQDKLVWVARGRLLDVAVDIRRGSPTYGQHVALELSAAAGNQLFVPAGFAHGYCTLEPDTEIVYKTSRHYSPEHEGGLLWNDPALGIAWPVDADAAVVHRRDQGLPPLATLDSPFVYDGASA